MLKGRKRKFTSINSGSASKRARKSSPNHDIIVVDENGDLDAVLAQITEQEESEKLALRLQDQWNHSSGSGDNGPSGNNSESDEALARRLAEEWAQEDVEVSPIPGLSKLAERDHITDDFVEISKSVGDRTHSQHGFRAYSSSIEGGTPDTRLSEFRDFFTANKECTKCGKAVKSPRGHVRG